MDTYLDSIGEGDRDDSARLHDLSDDSTAVERAFAKIKLFRDKVGEGQKSGKERSRCFPLIVMLGSERLIRVVR
jgi:hypothetical protein